MKVAAYQAPLLPAGSMESVELIRARVEWCEAEGVEILCCPEAILGGLADNDENAQRFAISVESGQLCKVLRPLASDRVTTIVGFTEMGESGRLFNAAAVLHQGSILGIYRKLHPAIRKSIYSAGDEIPTFQVGGLKFGIVICRDSNYPEPARIMAAAGATALFVPTNNGLPCERDCAELAGLARDADVALATDNGLFVIRADVAGQTEELLCYGSSGIVDPTGTLLQSAQALREELIVADI